MNPRRLRAIRSPRVYTAALCAVIVVVAGLAAGGRARAQVDITVQPWMTKGAATAPVTIVEFSDYQ